MADAVSAATGWTPRAARESLIHPELPQAELTWSSYNPRDYLRRGTISSTSVSMLDAVGLWVGGLRSGQFNP